MKCVMIVDDKEENRYYLQALLQGHGYVVSVARHGAEALVKARQSPPDSIISDLLMPVMDGYTLLRHWKADPRLKRIPFIVYTATYTETEDERLALRLGADEFILKPSEPDDFIAKLKLVETRPAASGDSPMPPEGEQLLLKEYSETLIRKLEDKSLQLEETNRVLCESEERFRQLAENIDEVFWMSDASKNEMIYISPAYERIWGRTRESLYAAPRTWLDAVHPEERERVHTAAMSKQALDDYDETYRIMRPDGTVRWIRDRAFAVKQADGIVYRIVGIAEDITERRLAEQALRESEARFSTIFKSCPIAIGITSQKSGRILDANERQCELFGYTREEMIGRTGEELNLWAHQSDRVQLMNRLASEGSVQNFEAKFRHRTNGLRDVLLSTETLALAGESDPVLVWMANDITERKKIESQFLRAQRMESIGTLAGGIAHDLNNVLTPILMAIEVLKIGEQNTNRLDMLCTIEESTRRGAEMVRQVLSFARGVEGQRIEVQIRHLLRDIAKITNDTFLKNIRVVCQTPSNLWPVTGDPTQLHQVLLNLSVNARDAMPDGGTLRLTAENFQVDEHYAGLTPEAKPGPYVAIRVEDSGMGMPSEILDRIFEPFFTTKELGKGTGLGLSTSLAIVKSHHGFIRVYSELGKGTTFKVFIPARSRAEKPDETATTTALPPGNGELVLVVDDERSVREITSRTLEAFGYRALLAADGAEAVRLLTESRGEVALALVDMMMPVLDGPATMKLLRKVKPTLPLIAASGLLSNASMASPKLDGVRYFLAKPYTAETLLTTLQVVLHPKQNEGL